MQQGSEQVSGGRGELVAACVTHLGEGGRTGDASAVKERRVRKD